MHNLKDLRKNLEFFKKKFNERNLNFDEKKFDKLDKINRDLINKKEQLEQEKKNYQNQKTKKILKNQKKFQIKSVKLN